MNRHQAIRGLLVIGMAAGLHFAYSGISRQVAGRFSEIPAVASEGSAGIGLEIQSPALPESPQPLIPPLALTETPMLPVPPLLAVLPTLSVPSEAPALPVPPEIKPAVNFWRKVYAVYTTDQVVLHDKEDFREYKVLDFSPLENLNLSDSEKETIRSERVEKETAKLEGRLSPEAAERVRSQTGLRDKFENALKVSGKYLPWFEEIFASYGLPTELTRLIFVESLFQERTFSKVGAAGFWQFMPSTGRIHQLKVERLVDERFDPFLATDAAARLLRKNYELLGNWPLAISAYNSGARNLQEAVDNLGTREIGRIVKYYQSPSFGFASRNFYAEFLAALEVSERAEEYFGPLPREPLLIFDVLELPVSAAFPQIAFLAGAALSELEDLNPAYAPIVFRGNYLLPAGSQVRIPVGHRDLFAARFLQYYRPGEAAPVSFAESENEVERR